MTVSVALVFEGLSVRAATWYVDASRPDDHGAATNWATARKTIEGAAALASAGDTVLVTNGTYQTTEVEKAILVESVNGPAETFIDGDHENFCVDLAQATLSGFTVTNGNWRIGGGVSLDNGALLINCVVSGNTSDWYGAGVYVWGDSTLSNCVISGNSAGRGGGGVYAYEAFTMVDCIIRENSAVTNGGGVYLCDPPAGGTHEIKNCIFENNQAGEGGGGASLVKCTVTASRFKGNSAIWGGGLYGDQSTLNSCLIYDNDADGTEWDVGHGGGVCSGDDLTLNNCTVVNNRSQVGAGVYNDTGIELNNCIVWSNQSGGSALITGWGTTIRNTCSEDGVTHGENGCITSDPQFVNAAMSNFRLQETSPCINSGSDSHAPSGKDAAGNIRRVETVDMGAFERQLIESSESGPGDGGQDVHIVFAGLSNDVLRASVVASNLTADAQVVGQDINWIELRLPPSLYPYGELTVDFSFECSGGRTVVLTNAYMYTKSVYLTYYVDSGKPYDFGDGQSWETAFCILQSAIDLARATDTVLATNGVYSYGSAPTPGGSLSNRVCITNGATVRSVNGPEVTQIRASEVSTQRCAYVSGGSTLSGFELSGGWTFPSGALIDQSGGNVWMEDGTVTNCILNGGEAAMAGGAVVNDGGLIVDSVITNNYAGFEGAALINSGGKIDRCRIVDNVGHYFCGGIYVDTGGELNNCLVEGNISFGDCGGVRIFDRGQVNNCTVVSNRASGAGGVYLSSGAWMANSIVWANSVSNSNPNIRNDGGSVYNTCAPDGIINGWYGCTTADPKFAAGGYRLLLDSPCINTGTNSYAPDGTDLIGNTRIYDGIVDMGAYEMVDDGSDVDLDALTDWQELFHYGSDRTNPDTDGDTVRDGDEAVAGTSPTDSSSVFTVTCSRGQNGQMVFNWSSVSNRHYALQGRTNLTSGTWTDLPDCAVFAPVDSIDMTPTNGMQFFRLRVSAE